MSDDLENEIRRMRRKIDELQAQQQDWIERDIRRASREMIATLEALVAEAKTLGDEIRALRRDVEKPSESEMLRPMAYGQIMMPTAYRSVPTLTTNKTYECTYECNEDRIDGVRWFVACERGVMPDVTPGEIVEHDGQTLMVTKIAHDLVFFEAVEDEPEG